MSLEQDNFEPLRRLLALKRHEQPPPGYFEGFSRQVVLRIKHGERGEEEQTNVTTLVQVPWLQRLLGAFSANPTLASAFGVALCSLLVAGVAYSSNSGASSAPEVGQGITLDADSSLQLANQSSGFVSSTNGFIPNQVRSSLFEDFRNAQAQPPPALVKTMAH